MYKQLKKELDEKELLKDNVDELTERIEFIIHRRLGLRGSSYSDIKLEKIGVTDDKYLQAFAKVERLDNERELVREEKKIIDKFIDKVSNKINNMDNLELNVFKCRYILGLTQEETADRLDYSIQRVKQIDGEISKKMKD